MRFLLLLACARLCRGRLPLAANAACRSPLTWPFISESVWNTPLGSDARFGFTGLYPQDDGPNLKPNCAPFSLGVDEMVFLPATAADPLVPWYNQGHWGPPKTPEAYCAVTGELVRSLHVPENFTSTNYGGNNPVALLQPDGESVLLVQPVYRCGPGSPFLARKPGTVVNIVTEDGNLGGHGGSGLSGLGGALRLGEMLPGAPPIAHAIQLEFFAHLFYYRPPSGNRSECFTWPATQCDGYVFANCSADPGCYGGTNPLMVPGALLAIPSGHVAAVNASLTTTPARRLLDVLSRFGGYVVDDTFWNASAITAEVGVAVEFKEAYGFDMATTANVEGAGVAWYKDFVALMRALYVVTNNRPDTQGGGGTPLAPPPPPFC